MDNCLVNVSGSPTGFMACDLLGEYIVQEYKLHINKNINHANDLHHRNVYGPQIMTAKMVRDHIYEAVGAVQHYQHSSTVNVQIDVQTITWELLRQRVFFETPGRTNYTIDNGRPIDEAIDLFGLGVACIATGTHIEAYKKKALGQLADAEEQSKPEANDEILDPEHEDYIDEDY